MRIYIESTIPSYVVARPARDLLQAARQQLAKDWWEFERSKHELFTSQVLDEIAAGEPAMARERLNLVVDLKLLDVTEAAKNLTKSILASRVLRIEADRDAAHIALATVHEMDMLLTWNCRHIAQRKYSETVAEVSGGSRVHSPGNLHTGRTDGYRR